ncbi:hypothetical protein GALMADRAFT_149122 [Galerina marginata CBS 339.88]|uniref:Uncharacterized protein n=1 Tax=Galerina marginata (strain CBS 339.88) TaxID=685588 RepID=A0A067S529_GALM3|nr:hypothetical protein GALMADRAFT_149122 [Galerina marginata CBS 339.88]
MSLLVATPLPSLFKTLVVKDGYNKPGHGVRLARFQLSAEEWKLVDDLSALLDPSLIRQVIPIFDVVATALAVKDNEATLPLAFMDDPAVYRVAMIIILVTRQVTLHVRGGLRSGYVLLKRSYGRFGPSALRSSQLKVLVRFAAVFQLSSGHIHAC